MAWPNSVDSKLQVIMTDWKIPSCECSGYNTPNGNMVHNHIKGLSPQKIIIITTIILYFVKNNVRVFL